MKLKHLITKTSAAALAAAMMAGLPVSTSAGQSDFIGEIIPGGYNFCPRGSLPADGQLLPIAQYTALFSILGTTYGGDGRTTFALPDVQGRSLVGEGTGPGLRAVNLGEKGGYERYTFPLAVLAQHTHSIPAHDHQYPRHGHTATLEGSSAPTDTPNPDGAVLGTYPAQFSGYKSGAPDGTQMDPGAVTIPPGGTAQTDGARGPRTGFTGGGQEIFVRDPYQGITWCVVVNGIFPSRN